MEVNKLNDTRLAPTAKKIVIRLVTVLLSGLACMALMLPTSAHASVLEDEQAAAQITEEDAQRGLDIIMEHTTGSDGRFNYTELVNAGVAAPIAIEYAGVLEAAHEQYTAPPFVQPQIMQAADRYRDSVQSVKESEGFTTMGFDWGKVLRVAGSYVECMAIRNTLLIWWPFAYCTINPDHNGTWLVIMY